MKCSLLTLSTYIDGEIEARRRGEVEAHLIACARCHAAEEYLSAEKESLSQLAPVRVPDSSLHAILVATGIMTPEQPLPPRPANASVPPPPPAGMVGSVSEQRAPWLMRSREGVPAPPPAHGPQTAVTDSNVELSGISFVTPDRRSIQGESQ